MATKTEIKPFFTEIYAKSNKVVEILLIGYFFFGIGISFFYDTFLVGIGVGSLCLILYFSSKFLFKNGTVNQYMASLVAGIFMAQFIYQMHGLFEMHFTAFIAIIALITYQNKLVFIPQLLFVVVHHSAFAYIQYLGVTNQDEQYQQIYFTQLEYMDFQTFLFHAGLYALGVVLAAIYAHELEKNTTKSAENILKLRKTDEHMSVNINFANDIASGNFDLEYQLQEGDKMGSALLDMRDNLKSSQERESREKFINVGIAEISEIIRNHHENLDNLSYEVISYLVKYLQVNQGGIFVLIDDNDDTHLELKGCYAYDRKKFKEKRIEIGQGLIGQCYLEKDVVHLKEVPGDYMSITSGLGKSTPSNLIMVPIKNDQVIEGVMELASFRDFEKFEMDFLVKVGENIAANITSAKVNSKTKTLYEESQQQSEELRAQEEEMRQNMEELAATQEEMERKALESEARLNAIDNSGIGSIEFDLSGNIKNANEVFCELMQYTHDELIGKHHRIFVDPIYAKSDEYQKFWEDLRNGTDHHGEYLRYTKSGKLVNLFGAYSAQKDSRGRPSGVLKLVVDNTKLMTEIDILKKQNKELSDKLDSIDKQS